MGGVLALTACASTVATSTGSSEAQSSLFSSNAVPKPSPTLLRQPDLGAKPPGWLAKGSGSGSLIYVADGNQVEIFPESGSNPAPIGAITDKVSGAYGLFVDGKRDLYVANSTTITAYRPGTLHPYIVYSDPASPLYVVEDHAGRLYAANRNGTVTEYPPHKTSPDRTLQTPGVEADGINVDDASNLYVAYRGGSTSGSIEKFPPHSTKGRILGMLLDQPQGLQLDHSGNILVVETGSKQVVDIFAPGSQSPSQVVQSPNGVTQVVLRDAGDNMYVSNFATDNVYISHYPPGELQLKIDTGLNGVQGMALSNEER
jgi:DNA-binding beta-propeller fold protein YncE